MNAPLDIPWVQRLHGGIRWMLAPALLNATDAGHILLGPTGLRLDAWQRAGQAHLVKQGPHASVHRVVLPGCDLHIKHYRGDTRERCRQLVRGSKARREARLTRAVALRGVPTLEVLGYGESLSWWGAESYLITRTLAEAFPLVDLLDDVVAQSAMRQQLARALGSFLAQAHSAGIRHDDLHVGNLLVQPDRAGPPRLYLIDLHAVRLGSPLPWPAARANLVVLDRYFYSRAGRTDRLRALAAYAKARPELALAVKREGHQLHEMTRASFIHFAHALDRRALGGNRHFRRLPGGVAVSDLDPAILRPLMEHPDEVFARPDAQLLKCSGSSAVAEIDLIVAGQSRKVIFKRFTANSWSDPLRALFRVPPATWSFRMGHALRWRGLPTPRPLAVWHERRAGLPTTGYLLVEKVPDARDLGRFVATLTDRVRRHRLIDECARLVRRLHERGLSHRDLKAANVLVSPASWSVGYGGLREEEGNPAGDRVWLIDLVGVRRRARVERQRQVRDLARLHVSFLGHATLTRSDRLRFLRTYLTWGLAGREGWKRWWKEIDQWAQDKVVRNRRLGRVVG